MAELQRAEITARIKLARTEAGLTQPELADLLQVHWRTVQNWETDRVPWDRLDEIGKATGTSRDWLLHGDDAAGVGPAAVSPELTALADQVAQLRAQVDRIARGLGLEEPPRASGGTR